MKCWRKMCLTRKCSYHLLSDGKINYSLFRMSDLGRFRNHQTKKFMFKLEYPQGTTHIKDALKSVGSDGAFNIWIQESDPSETVEKVTGFEEIESQITDSACWGKGGFTRMHSFLLYNADSSNGLFRVSNENSNKIDGNGLFSGILSNYFAPKHNTYINSLCTKSWGVLLLLDYWIGRVARMKH